ncbi:MAG: GGDEF domain-containing protein [Pseudomonadota bacterium]|jgi:diguanylate cyclase (GGDEF)-like protein|nr:GGDEF domain-containing protein [Pseudomonadota bacterium]
MEWGVQVVVKLALGLLPLALLPVPFLLRDQLPLLAPGYQLLLNALPWLLALLVTLLAIGFKHGRILLLSLHSACAAALVQLTIAAAVDNPASYVLLVLLSLFWPLGQVTILLLPPRSPLSRSGLLRCTTLLLLYCLPGMVWFESPGLLARLLPELPAGLLNFIAPGVALPTAAFWWNLLLLLPICLLRARRLPVDALATATLSFAFLLGLSQPTHPVLSSAYHLLAQLLLIGALVHHGYTMAFIDTLTGVPGRRALEHHLIGAGRHYAIAMLDIDHFKQFNDRYGHDVGDQVLRMVAAQLNLVRGGRLFRYGGEEFTIVFKRRSEQEAFAALEQVRQGVADYPMKIRQQNRATDDQSGRRKRGDGPAESRIVKVTISIGVCQKQAGETAHEVIKRADQALYLAKGRGRNCTQVGNEAPPAAPRHKNRSDFARA